MFEQVVLQYAFNALEPHIDEETMLTHYSKHHAAYTANLNSAMEKLTSFSDVSIEELLSNLDKIPDPTLRNAVRNNGGGYYNHNLYFAGLTPNGQGKPSGALAEQIDKDFGSFDAFKAEMTASATARFGSGWAWLAVKEDGTLFVTSTPNQDNPLMTGEGKPILALDVWEHAYYLKYKNLRADYIKAFWNVVDWDVASRLYEEARK